jgi:hypothetical protein
VDLARHKLEPDLAQRPHAGKALAHVFELDQRSHATHRSDGGGEPLCSVQARRLIARDPWTSSQWATFSLTIGSLVKRILKTAGIIFC